MGNISKIIYILEAHFNQRDYDRFGIETLLKNGFQVELWDFTAFLTNDEYKKILPPDPIDFAGIRSFKNKKDAISAISTLTKACFVIPVIRYNFKTLGIFKMLSKRGISFSASIQSCVVPNNFTSMEYFEKGLKRIIKISPSKVFRRIFYMVPFEWFGIRPADIVLAPAEKYSISNFPYNSKSNVLWLHSLDYDKYLAINQSRASVDENTGVFLDQYLAYHPDIVFSGGSPIVTAKEYYPLLRSLFNSLEKKFGVKIIVAAHPRSHYENHQDLFGGRPVIRGKTAELVQNSGFVILHNSIAINYAVLFKKPMIFVTTNQINMSFIAPSAEGPSVNWLSAFFGKKAHNLDDQKEIDLRYETSIDQEAYKAFKNDYIKKEGSEELPFWQIFANYIRKLRWPN